MPTSERGDRWTRFAHVFSPTTHTPSPLNHPTQPPFNLTSTLAATNASLSSLKTALHTANWTALKTAAAESAAFKPDLAAARSRVVSALPSPPDWFAGQASPGDLTCYIDPSTGRVAGLAQGGQTFGYETPTSVTVPLATAALVDMEFVLTAANTVGSFVFWVLPDGVAPGKKAVPVLCGVKAPTPVTAFSAAQGVKGDFRIVDLSVGFYPPTPAAGRRRKLRQTGGGGGGALLSMLSVATAPAPVGGSSGVSMSTGGAFRLVPASIPLEGPCTVHQYNGPDTGLVSCQNCLNKPVDSNSQVLASNFNNAPTYNAQCGKCLKVTNLNQTDAPPLFYTIIDFKGDPGLDLNQGYTYARWSSIFIYGKVPCKWEFVDASNCPWTPNVDPPK